MGEPGQAQRRAGLLLTIPLFTFRAGGDPDGALTPQKKLKRPIGEAASLATSYL